MKIQVFIILSAVFALCSLQTNATCPNLDGAQVLSFVAPSPQREFNTITSQEKLLSSDCLYHLSSSTALDQAGIAGKLVIKLKAGTLSPRCPQLTGLTLKVVEPYPATAPFSISGTQGSCVFGLGANVSMDSASREGSLEFTPEKK